MIKKVILFLSICFCTICISVGAGLSIPPNATVNPKFSDYIVKEIYRGENHSPRVEDEYNSVELINALKNSHVNFAGHYIIYVYGCGGGCVTASIADAKTGVNVLSFPRAYYVEGDSPHDISINYRVESRLIEVSGIDVQEPDKYRTDFFLLEKNKLKTLKSYVEVISAINSTDIAKATEDNVNNTKNFCDEANKDADINKLPLAPLDIYAVIGKGKLYFNSAPDKKCQIENLFIMPNEQIIVHAKYDNFYQVVYVKKNGDLVRGWLDETRLSLKKESFFSANITSLNDNKARACKDLIFDEDDYRSGEVCFYQNKKLLEAYTLYKKENKDNDKGKFLLEKIMMLKDKKEVVKEGYLTVIYHWESDSELNVELWFAGGVTTLSFREKDNNVEQAVIYEPD